MKKNVWVLLGVDAGWQVVKQSEQIERSEVSQSAAEVVESFRVLGYKGLPVVVGLHSDQCVTGQFDYDESQAVSQTVLLYGLEQVVPFPAEELSASFQTRDGKAYAVAALSLIHI